MFGQVQEQVRSYVEWLRLLVEALGALVIAAGVVLVVIALVRHILPGRGGSFIPIRLSFARYLTLALELQLGADILSTSVARLAMSTTDCPQACHCATRVRS